MISHQKSWPSFPNRPPGTRRVPSPGLALWGPRNTKVQMNTAAYDASINAQPAFADSSRMWVFVVCTKERGGLKVFWVNKDYASWRIAVWITLSLLRAGRVSPASSTYCSPLPSCAPSRDVHGHLWIFRRAQTRKSSQAPLKPSKNISKRFLK